MRDPQIPAEAVSEAVMAILCETEHNGLDCGPRPTGIDETALAALSAAYPALRAHIIRELAEEAEAERQRFEMEHRFPSDPRRHYVAFRTTLAGLSRAREAHRWLTARADQTKENQ